MFRLKATLVATTVVRPWRTGWSVERGVDFSVAWPAKGPAPVHEPPLPGERACFIDDDRLQPDLAVARTFTNPAAGGEPEPLTTAAPEARMRAWWTVAGKPSRT